MMTKKTLDKLQDGDLVHYYDGRWAIFVRKSGADGLWFWFINAPCRKLGGNTWDLLRMFRDYYIRDGVLHKP